MRHTTSFPRRAAALLLALLLAVPTVFAAAGEQKLQTVTQLVDGLTYRNTVTVNGGSRVESYSLELSPDSSVSPMLIQGDSTIYGNGNINRAVSLAQAQGRRVLGGINTDFFIMATGVPIGLVIEDGVYKSSNDGENALTLTDGRAAIVDRPQVSISLYDHNTELTVIPTHFNKTRSETDNIFLLNEYFSTVSTRGKGPGWYVRMKAAADPDTGEVPELTVNSSLTLEVAELILSDKPISIGPDEYILTSADAANRGDAYMAFQVGDKVTLTTSCEDPALSAAQWACGVGDIMVRDGVMTDTSTWGYRSDGRQPRSAMGIKPDGAMVFYAVDGRKTGHSVGLTQYNLAEELLNQGCTTVVNLDGGGSTALTAWLPGQSGPSVQNTPSDGRPRGCATYLLLVTDQKGDGQSVRLASGSHGQVVLAGSSLTLEQPKALDRDLSLTGADPGTVTYDSRNKLGTLQGGVYTAGGAAGTDVLSMTAGTLTGELQLHVVDQLTELSITRAGSSSALSSLSLRPGEQVQLAVSGSYWNREALRDFGPVSVTVQGGAGTMDPSGLFTAAQDLKPGGSVTFSAGGLSRTVQIVPTYVHDDVLPGHWAYDSVEYCYAREIVSGVTPTLFGPDNPMIRGDFILMLYRAAGQPAVDTSCTFTDVAPTDYYAGALAWAQSLGLASGTGDGRFSPQDRITREQAFTILHRFLPVIGKECPESSLSVLDQFQDRDLIAGYARPAAAALVAQGLVSGDAGTINPGGTLTRAQMAALVHRVMEHTPVLDVPTDPAGPDHPEADYKLALDQSEVTLASGGSVTLNASILPNPGDAAVTWTSSDPGAAAVSANGMVTNLYPGEGSKAVTVTASWNGLSASCSVVCQPAAGTGTVTNAENGLNVRSGPGTEYVKVGALRSNARVVVLSRQEDWYQVLFLNPQGQAAIGYVSAEYLTLNS